MKIITRFAPSPTGFLHIGGLRTALFNYLFARANGGEFHLRIEDTDMARNSKEATDAIIEAFEWLGLEFDGKIVYQSQNFELYKTYIQVLLDEKRAYKCYMSKQELDELRKSQIEKGITPQYDGRYRDFDGTPPHDSPVIRIKSPKDGVIKFKDGIKGEMVFNASEVDDFIIARSDGTPTYNFVVVIDDMLSRISHVIRGDDHLSNTPKQLVIYKALDFIVPTFYHIPMILGEDGKKLSKRHGALNVMEYKREGYLREALLNFLVRLGWSHGDDEIFSRDDLLKLFSPDDINNAPSRFSASKLNWINSHYIQKLDELELQSALGEFGLNLNSKTQSQKSALFSSLKERAHTLKDMANLGNEILHTPKDYDPKMLSKFSEQKAKLLIDFSAILESRNFDSTDTIKSAINELCQKHQVKSGELLQALRLALSGKSDGIPVAEHIFVLDSKDVIQRIKSLLERFD